ncbi:MAG: HAD family hydrolase [Pseudohongiellaceae bacterium]|nr:HAD family hydrolase [Pseudohongiellaceae bacterium]
MTLAIFDLDNTLLGGDSDHAWGDFVSTQSLVDPKEHQARNDYFYEQYKKGVLDMVAYTRFAISPVANMARAERDKLHLEFMHQCIEPMMLPAAEALVRKHKAAGDYCLIMTATNRFITEPIARRLEVDELIATELETQGEFYTGEVLGIPNFQKGKVTNLERWLQQGSFSMEDSIFYSDSFNDLPLLERAGKAVAVDPDDTLRQHAMEKGWEIISLR